MHRAPFFRPKKGARCTESSPLANCQDSGRLLRFVSKMTGSSNCQAVIRVVVEMKMAGKRPRGRLTLVWRDTVRRDMKVWSTREELTTARERWKGRAARPATPHMETAAKGEKVFDAEGGFTTGCKNRV